MTRRQLNSMIKLKNIKSNDTIIECDIYPEDSLQAGHIVVDKKSRELKKYNLPKNYEWCKKHVYHAKDKLLEYIKLDNIPDEKLIKWC